MQVENKENTRARYERPELSLIIFQEDIVTLSGGENGDGSLGSDLGDGQIGGSDIFE